MLFHMLEPLKCKKGAYKENKYFLSYFFHFFLFVLLEHWKKSTIFYKTTMPTSFIWSPKFYFQRSWLHIWTIVGLRRPFFFIWSTLILKYKYNLIGHFTMLLPSTVIVFIESQALKAKLLICFSFWTFLL